MTQFDDMTLDEIMRSYLEDIGSLSSDFTGLNIRMKLQNLKYVLYTNNGQKHGIMVLDWKRSVGINQIIRIEQMTIESDLDKTIVVANRYSANTREMVERKRVTNLILVTRKKMIDRLKNIY